MHHHLLPIHSNVYCQGLASLVGAEKGKGPMPQIAAPQIGGIVKQVDPLEFQVLECCIRPEPILHCCAQ
jgi:hypothetical protein